MVNQKPTRRSHTVPRGYLQAFAAEDSGSQSSRVWRFERRTGESKLVGVRDAEVVKDFYTIVREDGTSDIVIENIFSETEGAFCNARDSLSKAKELPTKEQWITLSRFVAMQLLRTPRFFNLTRDELAASGTSFVENDLRRVMLLLINRWINRLVRMNGVLAHGESTLPLLTSDNPAIMWSWKRPGTIGGLDQRDPNLVVSCPLSTALVFLACQTSRSLEAIQAEPYEVDQINPKYSRIHSSIKVEVLPASEIKRMNQMCLANADRYVYSGYKDKTLLKLLDARFFGHPAPVRPRDLKPIGSPLSHSS